MNGGSYNTNGFKFTSSNEIVKATQQAAASTADTLTAGDVLLDVSTTDNDVLELVLSGAANAAGVAASITNIETFNVVSSSAMTGGHTVDLTNVTGLKTVNIDGAAGAAITLGTAVRSGLTTVDASGQTGTNGDVIVDMGTSTSTANLSFTGGAGDDAFRGAAGNDTIIGGAGTDLLMGGSGADTISGGAGADNIAGGNGADVITGGGGGDFISVGGATLAGAFGANQTFTAGTGTADTSIDTVVFEATAAANGNDTIEGFTVGLASANGDVLDFSAFLGKAVNYAESTATATENMTGVNVAVVTDAVANAAAVANYTFSANEKVVVVGENALGTNAEVWFGTADGNGLVTTLTQVATIVGVAAPANFEANNFFGG